MASYKVRTASFALWSPDGGVQWDFVVLKELLRYDPWSLNIGAGIRHFGGTIGYTPDVLMRTFEVHGGIFHSYEDLWNMQFKPKIGIGVSVRL